MAGRYWLYHNKSLPLYDLISSAQADYTDNLMKFYQKGLGTGGDVRFIYHRFQHSFENENNIGLDASDDISMNNMEHIGQNIFTDNMATIMSFFDCQKQPYIPLQKL